jgi:hypothetical protein
MVEYQRFIFLPENFRYEPRPALVNHSKKYILIFPENILNKYRKIG